MTTPFVLDATTKSIQAVMSGAATTTNPAFTAAWADDTGSAFTEGATDGAFNGTTPVTLVAAPASSTRRVIKNITIANIDTAAVTITLSYDNNATLRTVVKVTLQVGDTWTTDGTFDTNGNLKTALTNQTITLTGVVTGVGSTAITTAFGTFTSATLATALSTKTGTGNNVFATQPVLTSNIPSTVASTSATGTTTFDMSTGNVQNFTFSGSSASDAVTFALSNVTTNQIFAISVTQNSGGSGTVTWFATVKWPGGTPPTLTTTASKRDTFVFICTGTNTYDGFISGQNL